MGVTSHLLTGMNFQVGRKGEGNFEGEKNPATAIDFFLVLGFLWSRRMTYRNGKYYRGMALKSLRSGCLPFFLLSYN